MKSGNYILTASAFLIFLSGAVGAQAGTSPDSGISDSQATQTITFERPGWHSISFDIEDVSYDQLLESTDCRLGYWEDDGEPYYVWSKQGGVWQHPEQFDVTKGYSFYILETGLENGQCSIELEGTPADYSTVELEQGWSMINKPYWLSFSDIKEQCTLGWWNSRLNNDNVDDSDISESGKYYFWVQDGTINGENLWRHPVKGGYEMDSSDSVYVYLSESNCTIEKETEEEETGSDEETSEEEDSSGESANLQNITEYVSDGWTFNYDTKGVDTSRVEEPEFSLDSASEGVSLKIDGRDSVCGVASWDKTFSPGSMSRLEVDVSVKDEPSTVSQGPQKVFIEVDGERKFEKEFEPGASDTFTYYLDSITDHEVSVGVQDLDRGFECSQYYRRTEATFDVSLTSTNFQN